MERGPDEAQQRLHAWAGSVSRNASATVELSDRVAGMVGTADVLDGAVRVQVDGGGRLTALELREAARNVSASELALAIMQAVARAQHGLTAQVADAVAATVGAESEAGRAVLDSYTRQYPDPEPVAGAEVAGQDDWRRDDDTWLRSGRHG